MDRYTQSYKNNLMGFAPDVTHKKSYWSTDAGKEAFLSAVKEEVSKKIGYTIDIADPQEIVQILGKTLYMRQESEQLVQEAFAYAVQLCVGRVKFEDRLNFCRSNMLQNQPRGLYDREKGPLSFGELKSSSNNAYAKFLQGQQRFR